MTMLLMAQKNLVCVCRLSNTLMITLLCGCAFTNTVSDPGGPQLPVGAISSMHHGVSLAVWLEDLCESQETDAQSLTMLEALHDGLVIPTEMLFAIAVVTVVSTVWSLYDRITLATGEPLPNRPQLVMEYVNPHWAGPQRDSTKSRGTHLPIAWSGCLSASRDWLRHRITLNYPEWAIVGMSSAEPIETY